MDWSLIVYEICWIDLAEFELVLPTHDDSPKSAFSLHRNTNKYLLISTRFFRGTFGKNATETKGSIIHRAKGFVFPGIWSLIKSRAIFKACSDAESFI